MHWFGFAGEYSTMVMDLLGQNLEDLFNFCQRNFTLKTILLVAIEIVIILIYSNKRINNCIIKKPILINLIKARKN